MSKILELTVTAAKRRPASEDLQKPAIESRTGPESTVAIPNGYQTGKWVPELIIAAACTYLFTSALILQFKNAASVADTSSASFLLPH